MGYLTFISSMGVWGGRVWGARCGGKPTGGGGPGVGIGV